MKKTFTLLLASLLATPCWATDQHDYHSKYAGQEKRQIKSLSSDDIQQLQQGKGWGLAKAAELNGMPGPAHVLEMKKEIGLSSQQEQQITRLFNDMKARAIPLGKQLLQLEKKLNDSFARQDIDEQSLQQQLDEIATVRSKLRYVHLVTHLQTPQILTKQQVMLYNQLRGYGSADPCSNIPKGHDPQMWKKHNGCK
jgi:Spy/CpxP family protein refolding chaperone